MTIEKDRVSERMYLGSSLEGTQPKEQKDFMLLCLKIRHFFSR